MTNPTQSETLLREALEECRDKLNIFRLSDLKDKAAIEAADYAIAKADTALQSIPEPLLDEGLVEQFTTIIREELGWQFQRPTSRNVARKLVAALSIPRLEAGRVTERCATPPDGWWCSREHGHDGPCAARAVNPASVLCDGLRKRFDDEPDWLGIEASHVIEIMGEAIQRIHRYALAAEGTGYDLILSVTDPIVTDVRRLAG